MNQRNMRLCQQHMLGLGRKSVKERLAYLFLELFYRVRSVGDVIPGSTEDSVVFPLSQEELADAMGLTAVHVSWTLKQLTEDGLLPVGQRRLTIYDEERLAELAQFDRKAILLEPVLL